MQLSDIDIEIHKCNLCSDMIEKFPNSKTVSKGRKKDIVILGEAPANNGWRKSGIAWYDVNHKLLPSGVVLQKLLDIINLTIEDTYFLEAIKCFPKERKYSSVKQTMINLDDEYSDEFAPVGNNRNRRFGYMEILRNIRERSA